jgi:hypothetical protein
MPKQRQVLEEWIHEYLSGPNADDIRVAKEFGSNFINPIPFLLRKCLDQEARIRELESKVIDLHQRTTGLRRIGK